MLRIFPFRAEDFFSTGTRMMTGRDSSYRRTLRRSFLLRPRIDPDLHTPEFQGGTNELEIFHRPKNFGEGQAEGDGRPKSCPEVECPQDAMNANHLAAQIVGGHR